MDARYVMLGSVYLCRVRDGLAVGNGFVRKTTKPSASSLSEPQCTPGDSDGAVVLACLHRKKTLNCSLSIAKRTSSPL